QVTYILQNSGARAAFLEDRGQWKKLEAGRLPSLRFRILISGPRVKGAMTWNDLRASAERGDEDAWERGIQAIRPSDTATIVYTSGTTGPPKGAVLSHANFLEEGKIFTKVFDL